VIHGYRAKLEQEIGAKRNQLARQGNYDIIFERTMGGIAFQKDVVDITQTVITIFDTKIATIAIYFMARHAYQPSLSNKPDDISLLNHPTSIWVF
jgi:hypothetical protein